MTMRQRGGSVYKILGKTYHRGARKDVDIVLGDNIAYMIASRVIPQGLECDALAEVLHVLLPGVLKSAVELAQKTVTDRERVAAFYTRRSKTAAAPARPSERRA